MNDHVGVRSWAATLSLLLIASLVVVPHAQAKSKHKKMKQQHPNAVGIYVIGHLPLEGSDIAAIATADDRNRNLLRLTDVTHRTISTVDVTNAERPKSLGQSELPAEFVQASLQLRVGDAALFSELKSAAPAESGPRSVTLANMSDSAHPTIVQKFEGVTAIWNDTERELIYLANGDGLWVLQVYSEADKRAEEEFEEMFKASMGGG